MSTTWAGFVGGRVEDFQGKDYVTLKTFSFSRARMKRGDIVYLFTRAKKWAVMVGSIVITHEREITEKKLDQENVIELPRITEQGEIEIGGRFTPQPNFKVDIDGIGIRPFDYEAFMKAKDSRKAVSMIIKGNFWVPAASFRCQVIQFNRPAETRPEKKETCQNRET